MSHTLDIETEEDEVIEGGYGYLFLFKDDESGLYLEACADVTKFLGTNVLAQRTAAKLLNKPDTLAEELHQLFRSMSLRSRFAMCDGPYLVKTHLPLTPTQLEKIILSMHPDRRKEFLKGAKL